MKGLEILIEVRPDRRNEFLRAVEWLVERETRLREATSVSVYEQHGSPNHFLWVEHWLTDEQLRKRLVSEPFQALQGAIQVLGKMTSMSLVEVEDRPHQQGAKKK